MRLARWFLAGVVVGMLALDGCGEAGEDRINKVSVDLSSPKGTLEIFEKSFEAQNLDVLIPCIAPDYRETTRTCFEARFQELNKRMAVKKSVAKDLGTEVADAVLRPTSIMEMSPLREAVENGKVNWGKINIKIAGGKATVEISGKVQEDIDIQELYGQWFWVPVGEFHSAAQMKQYVDMVKPGYAKMIKGLDDFEKKVKAGLVTKEDAMVELERCEAAAMSSR